MILNKVKIASNPERVGRWRLWYNDTEIKGMTRVSFEQRVEEPPIVTITLIASVDIEAMAVVEIVTDAPLVNAAQ